MNTTVSEKLETPEFINRTDSPPVRFKTWDEGESAYIRLQNDFAEWVKSISANEKLFKTHVYDNQDLTKYDLRQHRGRLCHAISVGDGLALAFSEVGQSAGMSPADIKTTIALIDQHIDKLCGTLFAWHGPLNAQADIPESFKQAAQEAGEEKMVDLDV
jgi:hypothetical protein